MHMIRCMIVDDEPIARDILLTYCAHLTWLQVVNVSSNALHAKDYLESQQVDLLFLDINMPVLDGIKFFSTLKKPPLVIFTTAYKEYATEAFNIDACDYLLKPFSLERFIIAVDKAKARLKLIDKIVPQKEVEANGVIFIKTEGKLFKVHYDDLLFVEASGNNTKVFTTGRLLIAKLPLSSLEEQLKAACFIRVHRSFIINHRHISHISGNRIFIKEQEIPIGENYRKSFFTSFGLG